MSVLIKGIEMPKSCDKCELMTANYGCAFVGAVGGESYRKRAWDCPLVEVPEHGRLIDADCCNDYFYEHMSDDMMIAAMNAINEMPTIIETEKT